MPTHLSQEDERRPRGDANSPPRRPRGLGRSSPCQGEDSGELYCYPGMMAFVPGLVMTPSRPWMKGNLGEYFLEIMTEKYCFGNFQAPAGEIKHMYIRAGICEGVTCWAIGVAQ